MTPDTDQQMRALFAAGDPAARLNERLPTRVAARLAERKARPWSPSFARAVGAGVLLASSAGLGAAAVWVTKEASTPPPVVVAATVQPKPAMVPADPLALEAALLRASLEALQRGDAAAALARLDERRLRFPAGAFEPEAQVARARALLLARRTDEALAAFEALPESELSVPLKLTWADLLVGAGRCPEALAVLEGVSDEARVAESLRRRCGR